MAASDLVDSDDIRLVTDVGFIALTRGFDREAMTMFKAVAVARPDQEAGAIGIALVHLLRGAPAEAIAVLRKLPPSDAALTFLGLAESRLGDAAAARRRLADVKATALDEPYAALAGDILKEIGSG